MSQIFNRFITYVGKVKLEQLPEDWQKAVDSVVKAAEEAVRSTFSIMSSLQKSPNRHL